VRINSQGRTLNQADFILTLMSVFWDEGRKQLEDFVVRPSVPRWTTTLRPIIRTFNLSPTSCSALT
jgi:hypothetical protein